MKIQPTQRFLTALRYALPLAACAGTILSAADSQPAQPAPGGPEEPVRYIGQVAADANFHDGALRPVVGVKNYQVMRANRTHPDWADGRGWTYSHEPMLAHAHGRFYLHWFLSPQHEHESPSHTMLVSSTDGVHWEKPRPLFPVYPGERNRDALMHQRSGFYMAPNGRLLATGFYGFFPGHISGKGGIGRVVREIYSDNTFGPIYFIRYNTHNGWGEENTLYPLYTRSSDAKFVEACQSLLGDKLHTLAWWEEDRSQDGFYTQKGVAYAASFFHRADGKVVALWKNAKTAISSDEGKSWSSIVTAKSVITSSGKNWGQKMPDGRYAMVYNPTDTKQRWPLSIVTGSDGILFDNMLAVHGEVPPQRFGGLFKNLGPQYVRGIAEGNGTPPDGGMWIAYSMNKEDIWVSRIPVPAIGAISGEVNDTFDSEGALDVWNTYNPLWAPVSVDLSAGATERTLQLRDKDPYDYAKAVRVFPESEKVVVSFRVRPAQNSHGRLEVELVDDKGRAAARLVWADDGKLHVMDGPSRVVAIANYEAASWMPISIELNTSTGRYRVTSGDRTLVAGAELVTPVRQVERLVLRTGQVRVGPTLQSNPWFFRNEIPNAGPNSPLYGWNEDLRAPDDPEKEAVFHLDDVVVSTKASR